MTAVERALKSAFACQKRSGGRKVRASTGEVVDAIVEDIPTLADPVEIAQAKLPVFTRVYVMAGEIANPRDVAQFNEVGSERFHLVLKYEEASQANWRQCWLCEAQRAP